MSPARNRPWVLVLLPLLAAGCLLGCPFVGMERIPFAVVFGSGPDPGNLRTIFWQIRVPRVCIGFLAGAGLAACGMAFQALFRNALATPFTLGVAGGASLGAALYVRLGVSFALLTVSGASVFAFLGALGSICLVYGLTRLRRGFSTATMLLAGIAVNLFFSSLILFLQYLSDFTQSFQILRWLMGGLETMGYGSVLNLAPMVGVGLAVLFALTHELNLLTIGEDLAVSRGVDVPGVKRTLFLATSVCVGGVVAVCGPIGFVGMMVPHICRLLVGGNHRRLLPACCLFGGVFLTLCDTAARTVIAPAEVPVGVITSVLGGPFFVWLLVGAPAGGLRIVRARP
ncbi:MAG: iron ABC transporter permease [Lentisphaeria bacterium]|nr:iron ABC transporter permease [Lentisphaeria bacterium]